VLVAVFVAAFLFAAGSKASAQSSINFNGGYSIDPNQGYAGVSWETPDLGGRFRVRAGLDGGFGEGLRLGTVNIDLIGRFPLGGSGWTLIQGGGPVISIAKLSDFPDAGTEVHGGASYLFGFHNDNGFFGEFRYGGGGLNIPSLKFGVGWAIKLK
jgi:hypothetical protein